MTMDRRKETGRRGEDIAVSYLTEKGYNLIQRNWRCATGELDIIMEEAETIIFVEVRTRRGRQFGTPEESITPAKQTRLIELAETYLQATDDPDRPWRIDVVAIRLGPGLPRVNHLENAVGW